MADAPEPPQGLPSFDSVAPPRDDAAVGAGANESEIQRAAVRTAITPKHRYIHLRSYATPQEVQRINSPTNSRWPHVRPDSVLICPMGYYYPPGCWHKLMDMVAYSQQQGIYVAISELQDRCLHPYDALGTMRNEAILMAQNEGFEWLLYMDNDAMPERDTLVRLLHWQMPITAPYVAEPGTGRRLFGPTWEPNQGLKPVKWVVLTMLLFRVKVFNATGHQFWSDAVGADEGYHFQKLWHYGHQPFLDTNTQLITAGSGPHYPLSSNRLQSAEARRELWERLARSRAVGPDRTVARGPEKGAVVMPPMGPNSVLVEEFKPLPLVTDGLTYQQRQDLEDFEIRMRTLPPNRSPLPGTTSGVIEGEYLPVLAQPQPQQPKPTIIGWGGG